MGYLVYDRETTTRTSFKRKANPYDSLNWTCALGFKHQGGEVETVYYDSSDEVPVLPLKPTTSLLVGHNLKFDMSYQYNAIELQQFLKKGGKVWCTQLAEYYLMGQQQQSQMVSMDDIVEKYGGELKIDEVKALWNAGVDTPDIPEDLLIRYLRGDISNTETIFLGQLSVAKKRNMLPIIMARMEGYLCTVEMEYNGLCIDKKQAYEDKALLEGELEELSKVLNDSLPKNMPEELVFNWGSGNHKSALLFGGAVRYEKWCQHLDDNGELMWGKKKITCLISAETGEPAKLTLEQYEKLAPDVRAKVNEKVVINKGGMNKGFPKTKKVDVPDYTKPKGSKQDFIFEFKGYTKPRDEWAGKLTDALGKPVYSTNKDTMDILKGCDVPFIQALVNRETVNKDLGTYYLTEQVKVDKKTGEKKVLQSGMLTCVMPDPNDDTRGFIHHMLNMCQTVTSRMSSSSPNLQNVSRADFSKALGRPKSLVKRMFVSRFGEDGAMCEIDYSQLEVIVQAVLSRDPQLMQDVIDGVDFHCKRLSAKLKEDYEEVYIKCHNEDHEENSKYKVMRTKIKQFTFQRAYGAGKAAIAAETGMTEDEVQELMDVEEKLYPGITKFYDAVQADIEKSRWQTQLFEPFPDGAGSAQLGKGEWIAPTGTRYVFTEKPAKKFIREKEGRDATFYRPHIQNYPIQGTGGEMVQVILGKLVRKFLSTDNYGGKAFLVNTVHDCVWFDCHKDVVREVLADAAEIMSSIPDVYNELFSHMDIIVPFRVDVEVGDNMMEMSHLDKYMESKGWK
jgi:DNA polymerase I-like protein with 3'-5' exonuclease and polymerase domains